MKEHEQQIIRNMEATISQLPEEKKQFFLGYAEGVAAMAEYQKTAS
jgi:hypothetical protein